MAVSRINMECKRYGCMKNLLACYANCRYNGRCDDLRSEIIAKSDQASKDINDYLRERGRAPITIQVMKRGLRFNDAPRQQPIPKVIKDDIVVAPMAKSFNSNRPRRKKRKISRVSTQPVTSQPIKTQAVKRVTSKQVSELTTRESSKAIKKISTRGKSKTMARKTLREESATKQEKAVSSNGPVEERDSPSPAKDVRSKNGSKRKSRGSSRNTQLGKKAGKLFIILEGKTATLVDEQGLIAHLLGNSSQGARYFEASEVEARLQIVPKR
jgi:hypothetical protein